MSYEKKFKVIDLLPDVAIGIKIPMIGKSGNLFDLSYSTEEQLLSNLKNLLFTNKGERVMQPEFGTDLIYHIFEPNLAELNDKIASSIEAAILYWLPYVTIVSIDAQQVTTQLGSTDEHGVVISLVVKLTENSISETQITLLATANKIEFI
jgi:phage baseplate assembly protein W